MTTETMTSRADRLLVVDDEAGVCELVSDVAEGLGFETAGASDLVTFRTAYARLKPTVIVLDLQMPGTDGVEHLRFLAENDCEATILLMSGVDRRVLESAHRLGDAHGLKLAEHLRKPVGVPELRARLRTLASSAAAVSRSALECAVANHEMVLLYQPKVALARDACEAAATELRAGGERWPLVGLEALVRWQRSAGEVLTPERFLPLAEASNLIKPLTLVVVRIAMAQMAAWAESGFRPVVALNLSGRLFDDLALPDELAALTAEFRVAPGQVVFEITETAAMADAAACLEVTTRLRLKGFSLSIDDFGTGYSSLVQLYRMPFSELKIDRTFVADMVASEEARTIVQSIIELARNLSMAACAEGVENRETSELLTGLGCARAQGYFFGRPLAAEALLDMMVHSRG